MALMETPQPELGWRGPDFSLTGTDGQTYSLAKVKGENGLLVMFICNHCPYVIAIADRLASTVASLKEIGVGAVAIMPNDTRNYPQDSMPNMIKFAKKYNFNFPYIIDETQDIAKAYGAVCTPDFFGLDGAGALQYRGRLDSARNQPVDSQTVPELLNAMGEIAKKGSFSGTIYPSMGCSIKWA